jgi:hypothetical protein
MATLAPLARRTTDFLGATIALKAMIFHLSSSSCTSTSRMLASPVFRMTDATTASRRIAASNLKSTWESIWASTEKNFGRLRYAELGRNRRYVYKERCAVDWRLDVDATARDARSVRCRRSINAVLRAVVTSSGWVF